MKLISFMPISLFLPWEREGKGRGEGKKERKREEEGKGSVSGRKVLRDKFLFLWTSGHTMEWGGGKGGKGGVKEKRGGGKAIGPLKPCVSIFPGVPRRKERSLVGSGKGKGKSRRSFCSRPSKLINTVCASKWPSVGRGGLSESKEGHPSQRYRIIFALVLETRAR